jgi:hypothetical protein
MEEQRQHEGDGSLPAATMPSSLAAIVLLAITLVAIGLGVLLY